MEKQDIHDKLKQTYQVMRKSETEHFITEELTMTIKTFVRVYPDVIKDLGYTVTFSSRKQVSANSYDWVLIDYKLSDVYKLLKEKYFKEDMVQF